MGLAAPKNRTKINADPRNTHWANATDRFGHRYLAAQGWTPGSTLGDTTSAYHQAGHVTEASARGVKIVLKDDTLGIGAKRGSQHDEATGLLDLQGLLGRLNGNEAQVKAVENEQERRRQEWVGNRYGVKFVKGETWTSDFAKGAFTGRHEGQEEEVKEEAGKKEGKKRKRAAEDEKEKDKKSKKAKSKSKDKKEKRDKSVSTVPSTAASEDESAEKPADKKSKSKKDKKSTSASASTSDTESTPVSSSPNPGKRKRSKDSSDREEDKKASKAERKKSKEERRAAKKELKRAEKARRKAEKRAAKKEESDNSSSSEDESEETAGTGTSTPVVPVGFTGRQALRNRFIAAKRGAMLDAKAMNEILMIKA